MDFKIDKVVFDTREEATAILESMNQIIKKYKTVTVADFFELANVDSVDYRSSNYGWHDISTAKVMPTDTFDGFNITFPIPFELLPVGMMIEKPDMVNHPPHYISESGIEVIDVIKAFTKDLKGFEATDTGNVIKYILRWKHKNGIEDLKKAQWYLNDLITELEKGE